MVNVGIIGAGNISRKHIEGYLAQPDCQVVAVADVNEAQAQKTAAAYQIPQVYTDYNKILEDKSIDAVSIVTPTFTHKEILLRAIACEKHILCEKPPTRTAEEAREVLAALQGYKKTFMYAMVCRFKNDTQYLKQYIDSGKMGKIICAEATRIARLSKSTGWLSSRKLGGGAMRDEAIHELDLLLYLMGYPKAKSVTAFESMVGNDLPDKIKSDFTLYTTADAAAHTTDTESIIKAFIELENGTNLVIRAGKVLLTPHPEHMLEINGQYAGASIQPLAPKNPLTLTEVTEDFYLNQIVPELAPSNIYQEEIKHFIRCIGGEECIVKPEEGVTLMEIIDAVYASAATGKQIILH